MMERLSCQQVESQLSEYTEGLLPGDASERIQDHVSSCASCAEMVEDIRLAWGWARATPEVPLPSGLVARILEQTTPKETRAASWRATLRAWVRPLLEPRFALGMAMTLISGSLFLQATGVNLRRIEMADLSPSNIIWQVERRAHLAGSRVVKFYRDLRIVYEIQTQLQSMREESEKKKPPEQRPAPPKPMNRKFTRQFTVMAAMLRRQ